MEAGTDRKYTLELRDATVKQVMEGGMGIAAVARSLEMSSKTLANWVYRARRGQALIKRQPVKPVSELEAENSRLRQENSRLRVEKEILKNRPRGLPRPICIETSSAYTVVAPGQRPLAFWRQSSPSKNLAQGKLRTQLWWHHA